METHLSPNQQPRPQGRRPDLIIIHATASGFDSALSWLCNAQPADAQGRPNPALRVSAHYLIGKTGRVVRLVEEDQEAWHAGRSCWEGFDGLGGSLNWRSIGIELENQNTGKDLYPDEQIAALTALLREICTRWGIPADRGHIVSHHEVTASEERDPQTGQSRLVYRKSDPAGLDVDMLVARVASRDELAGRYISRCETAIYERPTTEGPRVTRLVAGTDLTVDGVKGGDGCQVVDDDRRWAHLADGRGFIPLAHLRPVDLPSHLGLTFLAEPRIASDRFAHVLVEAGSPAADSAGPLYDLFVAEGLDPAVGLAFFFHESICGTAGVCRDYQTRNWGNCRAPQRPDLADGTVDVPNRGAFARYPSWEHGARDWCARIKERYVAERGLTTVELAVPLYAPSSDGNRPAAYIAAIRRLVASWAPPQIYVALQEANVRQAPRTRFANGDAVPIVAQLRRGEAVAIDLVKEGPDCETIAGEGRWAHLADQRGFIWLRSLRPEGEPAEGTATEEGAPLGGALPAAPDAAGARASQDDAATARYEQRAAQREEGTRLGAAPRAPGGAIGLRQVIGASDLMSVSFLEVGRRVARAVCRLQVRVERGEAAGYGTAFLVSPALLLTNNHVLDSPEAAATSLADFAYEEDAEGRAKRATTFRLDPERFFFTDAELDFTLVAVAQGAADGTAPASFGPLPLRHENGDRLQGACVSIVQHPGGGLKRIALRENRVVDVLDSYIHYSTDTQPGSSGSPVFDDQWRVVALHHAGVKRRDAAGNVLAQDGQVWRPEMGAAAIAWVANEGVRTSAICAQLRAAYETMPDERRILLDELLAPSPVTRPRETSGFRLAKLAQDWYAGQAGFSPDFLGQRVELPRMPLALLDDVVPLLDGSGTALDYPHFTVVISRERRLAYFTAVNIDGARLQRPPRRNERWYFDPRIDQECQCGPELYRGNDLDLGHLVRRLDPVWGPQAGAAEEATFHFTNCAPQHKNLNQRIWLDLEDYILKNAHTYGLKVSVFTGPVFRADDMLYRGQYRIPAEFWKVAVMVGRDGKLSATAYLQTQKQLLGDLEFAYGKYRTYQVPVTTIEGLTGLDFGALREHDPLANLEGTLGRAILGPADLRL